VVIGLFGQIVMEPTGATEREDLRERTKRFGSRSIKLCQNLPLNRYAQTLGLQFMRAATSVAANYRAACHARSRAEFLSKLCIVLEEADESSLWLEYLVEAQFVAQRRAEQLLREANEITRIFAAARKTARGRRRVDQTTLPNNPITK
jgi:four helix bundle protein